MTRERREEAVLVALVVSLALHTGIMLACRSHRFATPQSNSHRVSRHETMQLVNRVPTADPAKIAELLDVQPIRDAPDAQVKGQLPLSVQVAHAGWEMPVPPPPPAAVSAPPAPEVAVFDEKPIGTDIGVVRSESVLPIATPLVSGLSDAITLPALPSPPARLPQGSSSAADHAGSMLLLPSGLRRAGDGTAIDFKPVNEVYSKVDELVVETEKKAVRQLVDAEDAEELEKFVNVTMTTQVTEGWRYFRVRIVPRAALPVVPKDVVILLDGSGSIGNDRLSSCRKAARRILRTCANTGDRFNLVIFRDRFTYAFKRWQECDAESYELADRWLARQASHGRTDVFSTISSVLTLPRDPKRPLIALVVTDGEANRASGKRQRYSPASRR